MTVNTALPAIDFAIPSWMSWLGDVISLKGSVHIPNAVKFEDKGNCKSSGEYESESDLDMTLLSQQERVKGSGSIKAEIDETSICPDTCDASCNRQGTCGGPMCSTMNTSYAAGGHVVLSLDLCEAAGLGASVAAAIGETLTVIGAPLAGPTIAAIEGIMEKLICPVVAQIMHWVGMQMPKVSVSGSAGLNYSNNWQQGTKEGCCPNLNTTNITGQLGASAGAATFIPAPWPFSSVGNVSFALGACLQGGVQFGTNCQGQNISPAATPATYFAFDCIGCDIHTPAIKIPFVGQIVPSASCDSHGGFNDTLTASFVVPGYGSQSYSAPSCVSGGTGSKAVCPAGYTPTSAAEQRIMNRPEMAPLLSGAGYGQAAPQTSSTDGGKR